MKARFQRDHTSIERLFFDQPTGRKLGIICKALAGARKVYRCVEPGELERIGGTVHHGGVVAVVRRPMLVFPGKNEPVRWAKERAPVLLLDRIGNPHNLGAIARTAAFFGVPHLVVPDSPMVAQATADAAWRVAEGGLEWVRLWSVSNLPGFVGGLREAGYEVVGAASAGGKALDELLAERGKPGAPVPPLALVLGNEEQGLSPEVAAAVSGTVMIPGSGNVESLNVSAAAAVLIHALLAPRRRVRTKSA